jgi:diguanylate cyclase (GGDEF)-like protein
VDAALVTVADAADLPVTRAQGLSDEEVDQLAIERPQSSRIQSMTIAYVPDPRASAELPPVSGSVAVPIEARGRTVGVLSVFSRDEVAVFPSETEQALEDLAARAGPAIDNARRFQEARRLAEVDARTGLHNERYFETALAREVAGASRYGRRLALMVLDVDDFKQINDRFSRVVGDSVLRGVAERLSSVVRADDVACRMGGAADEFGIILREATPSDAERLYIRLRDRLQERPVPGVPAITLSGGISAYDRREDPEQFRLRADTALNDAKRAGKGRVEVAPPPPVASTSG